MCRRTNGDEQETVEFACWMRRIPTTRLSGRQVHVITAVGMSSIGCRWNCSAARAKLALPGWQPHAARRLARDVLVTHVTFHTCKTQSTEDTNNDQGSEDRRERPHQY